MTQQEFNDLSKRYLEGTTTLEEEQLLTEWYRHQPKQLSTNLSLTQKKETEKRMWQRIAPQVQSPSRRILVNFAWVSGIAASLLLGWIGYNTLFIPQPSPTTTSVVQGEQKGIEVKNTTAFEQEVRLEDGTLVRLKQNSSIVYDKSFNQAKRIVYLKGEAFFNVKRNTAKPFVVHSGELTTEVLGTSFLIKQHEKNNTIEVVVATGKVSVYTDKPNRKAERNGVILTPNQRVIYDITSKNMIPGIVEKPILLPTADPQFSFTFKDTSLEKVLEQLSLQYGIEFVISNPNAKDCRITADLNGLSMFTQLELICKSIDATYEKRGTVVFIYGDGC